jgi:hypothetical protein
MKIPVEILNIQDPDGVSRIRFTIAFQDAIQNTSLNKQIVFFQQKYIDTIIKCKKFLARIRESKKNAGDSVLKWYLSDIIVNFLNEMEENEFIINNYSRSLARDLGLSLRLIESMIHFRKTFPKIEMINQKINWDRYREILDVSDPKIRELLIEKILAGEIKNRNDIKEFKIKYFKNFHTRRKKITHQI